MKRALKKSANPFSGLWGKRAAAPGKQTKASSKPVAVRAKTAAELAKRTYAGPAHLVAASLLWGAGRLWPRDEVSEGALPWQAGDGTSIGILGAGLGAYGSVVRSQVPTATVTEFDWRSDVARWRMEQDQASRAETTSTEKIFYEINPGILLPPPMRCSCLIGAEPVFAQTGSSLLLWARLALVSGGTMVLEELAVDTPKPPSKEIHNGWMARSGQNAQWLRLDEQEAVLRRNGFIFGKIRERTGAHLRALNLTLDMAEQRLEPLNEAIKLVPSLQNVADHFNCERNAAKNRLKALEHGALAVYRIEVIKPRADELI